MVVKQCLAAAAVLALAACGGPEGNQSSSKSAAAGGSGVQLSPGEWEMKTEIVNVTAEGLPPGIANGMKQNAGATTRTCMTEEEAKGPKGDMFSGDQSGSCKSEGFSWASGRIQGKTTCAGQGAAGNTVMTMDGRYSPQSIDMTMKTESEVSGRPMTMDVRVTGRRLGDCPAGKAG